MDTTQRYKLLDGSFNPDDAKQVLLSLVTSKIDFHHREKFSNEERFGSDVAHSERRLIELQQLHETLRTLCQSAADTGMCVKVNGWIEIELIPSTEADPPTRAIEGIFNN
ncbi:hypothetical protein BH11VER1_BH11VER1_09900 [soil metagenome]